VRRQAYRKYLSVTG